MRDELRERIFEIVTGRVHSGDPRHTLYQEQTDAILDALEAFMREHGLKMMAEPIKDRRHYLAKKWWDAALLMPWEEKDG
jgi:hypothetical protein